MSLSLSSGISSLLGRGRRQGMAQAVVAPNGDAEPSAMSGAAAPSGEAAELLALVDRRYRWAREAKRTYLKTWATCLAFYVGEQYRTWDRSAQRLVERTRVPSWRVLLVDNQIPGIVEMAAAKLSSARQLPKA